MGLLPKRSESEPMAGEKRNCMMAQAVPKMPTISAARTVLPSDKAFNELGQHRNDDAKRQHVERHGDEDENESCGPGVYAFSSHSCSLALWNFQVRRGPAMTLR